MEQGYTWEIYLKSLRKTILKKLLKVTNKRKPPRMFSFSCNLTKNNVEYLPPKILSKKVRANNVDVSTITINQKKYVEKMWIFWSVKLRQKTHVETTWIFPSAELHWKSTWKRLQDSSRFGLWRINVILTSVWRGVPLGVPI